MSEDLNLDAVVATAVGRVIGQYSEYVDRDDLTQEAWLWIYAHPNRVERDPDKPALQAWRLASEISDALREVCRREKAQVLGYDPADEYFYGQAMLVRYLPFVVNGELEPPASGPSDVRGNADPAEGNGWQVARIDVASAWEKADLTDQERGLLAMYYIEDVSQQALAEVFGVTQQAISARISRATTKVVAELGGFRPKVEQDYIEERLRQRPGVRR